MLPPYYPYANTGLEHHLHCCRSVSFVQQVRTYTRLFCHICSTLINFAPFLKLTAAPACAARWEHLLLSQCLWTWEQTGTTVGEVEGPRRDHGAGSVGQAFWGDSCWEVGRSMWNWSGDSAAHLEGIQLPQCCPAGTAAAWGHQRAGLVSPRAGPAGQWLHCPLPAPRAVPSCPVPAASDLSEQGYL